MLDAHRRAFEHFGGVPRRRIYDNLKTAVKHIPWGRENAKSYLKAHPGVMEEINPEGEGRCRATKKT